MRWIDFLMYVRAGNYYYLFIYYLFSGDIHNLHSVIKDEITSSPTCHIGDA